MTTPPAQTHADPAATPPPGCPAHGLGPEGIRRLYGPEAESDPKGLYEKLRAEHGAVAPVLLHGDLPAWLVLGHRENLDATRTPSRFSKDSRRWTAFQQGQVAADSPLLPVIGWQPLCAFADGEEHKRLRGAVTDGLQSFDRRGVRRHVARFADQLVDSFAADGSADLVSQFAEHLPMLVMTQLFGMPEEYGPRLVEAARDLLKGTETAMASNEYVVALLSQLVERKRLAPGADLPSWLLQHAAGLSDHETMEHLRLILLTANETTVNLIADTLRMVLTDRRFRANLSGGHMTLLDALDQVLWDSPPIAAAPGRWATGDTELGGQQIREGDMLVLGLAAANVDPQIRPDLADPLYGNRSHLAFSSGPHECPGQDVGRAIAEVGIDMLLARLPDLQLGVEEDQLTWNSSWMSRHLAELPVEFASRRPKAGPADTLSTPVPVVAAVQEQQARPAPVGAPAQTAAVSVAAVDVPSVVPAAAASPVESGAPRRGWWGALLARLRGR